MSLITNIKVLHEETLNNLKNSKAINTLLEHINQISGISELSVRKNGFKSLPTEPKIVSLYLTQLVN